MQNLKISEKCKKILNTFSEGLSGIYRDELVSIVLYGSAASGEFVDKSSNLNIIVVLRNTDLEILEKSSGLMHKYNMINVLFLTNDYITSSTDVFPIEFLDMQDNYFVIYGEDVLKNIHIDMRNLRFQCEQELKGKLIKLKQMYLAAFPNEAAIKRLLFMSFGSIVHVLRNVLRLKGKKPPCLKNEAIKEIAAEFAINNETWQKILSAKSKQINLSSQETVRLFLDFTRDLEKIVTVTDKL